MKKSAAGPSQASESAKLKLGKHLATMSTMRMAADPAREGQQCVGHGKTAARVQFPCLARHRRPQAGAGALPRLPAAPLLRHPPKAHLPDLIPLPSSDIRITNSRSKNQLRAIRAGRARCLRLILAAPRCPARLGRIGWQARKGTPHTRMTAPFPTLRAGQDRLRSSSPLICRPAWLITHRVHRSSAR